MNKKVIIAVAAIAVALVTVKTGYAFYEKQNNDTVKNEIVNASQIKVNTENLNIEETDSTYLNENTAEDTTEYNQTSNCCGNNYGSMLDENGNLKDRDAYEKELDGYVANGDITEEDEEYYLFMYDKCAAAFADSDTESDSEGLNYPSCH